VADAAGIVTDGGSLGAPSCQHRAEEPDAAEH
jgi:hypothetical protein